MQKVFNKGTIVVLSILIPILVALLYVTPTLDIQRNSWIKQLPEFNAMINATTAFILVLGVWSIKNRKVELHKFFMLGAVFTSVCFLVSYVIYHGATEPTSYGGQGAIKIVYWLILFSHIILSAAIVPLVLITLYNAVNNDLVKHKKIARWTFPLWLYVAISGVTVYLMLSPYY